MSSDDVAIWPDGTWCYGSEIYEMGFMGDDYEVLKLGTQKHMDFLKEIGYWNEHFTK